MSTTFAQFIRIAGVALGSVMAIQAAWAVLRLLCLPHDRGIVRHIAAALHAAVSRGDPPEAALHGLQAQMRWPYPWRLRHCIALLGLREPPPLGEALLESRLVPPSENAAARAAGAGGRPLLLRWLADLAGPPPAPSADPLATYLAVLTATLWIFTFLMLVIAPKFEAIFADLGLALPPISTAVLGAGHAMVDHGILWTILAMAILGTGVWLTSWWRWRRQRRQALAGLLLAGLAAGRSEAELAEILATGLPERRLACEVAGQAGDLASLCAVCGWRAASPEALAQVLSRYQARRAWRDALFTGMAQTLAPVLVGIPVAAVVFAFFLPLVRVITALSSDSP